MIDTKCSWKQEITDFQLIFKQEIIYYWLLLGRHCCTELVQNDLIHKKTTINQGSIKRIWLHKQFLFV